MIYIDIKNLIYKHLQPMAQASGCQIFIADAATYKPYQPTLKSKAKTLGISQDEVDGLNEAIEEYGFVAILKSHEYLSAQEIAGFFSKAGLEERDVHYLNSANVKKNTQFGDFDASIPEDKRMFFAWFPIKVEHYDPYVLEHDDGDEERYRTIKPIEWNGIKGLFTVGDLQDAISKAFDIQKNAPLNFAPEKTDNGLPSGKILGQVNSISEEDGPHGKQCIMTLAPYKNGSRFQDCSVDGIKTPPLSINEVKTQLDKVDPFRVILVKYEDPLAFGPKAGQVLEVPIDHVEIDKKYGIFLRPREDIKPTVV